MFQRQISSILQEISGPDLAIIWAFDQQWISPDPEYTGKGCHQRNWRAAMGRKSFGVIAFVVLIALCCQSRQAQSQESSGTPIAPPNTARLCIRFCFELRLVGGIYGAYPDNKVSGADPVSTYTIIQFTTDTIELERRDAGSDRVTATLLARVDPRVTFLFNNGMLTWHNVDGTSRNRPFAMAWGNQISDIGPVPDTPAPAAPANHPAKSESLPSAGTAESGNTASQGFKMLVYPGTNFPTQFTAINDDGVIVGSFKRPASGATCDPSLFGGPCPQGDAMGDVLGVPYAFIYSNGKFARLRGPLVEVSNNLPVTINNRGQILIQHGLYTNTTMSSGYSYLVYDVGTGVTHKVGTTGGNGKGFDGAALGMIATLQKVNGLNSKGEICAVGEVIQQTLTKSSGGNVPGVKHEYGLIYGMPGLGNTGSNATDPPKGHFRQFEVSLPQCPKMEGQAQYVGDMRFAGPNDKGQIAVSCNTEALIFDATSQGTNPLSRTQGAGRRIEVHGISNAGSVVGCAEEKAFVYAAGNFSLLPLKSGSCAMGMNSKGQVVGFSGDKAFVSMTP